jgi:hypothetical protein
VPKFRISGAVKLLFLYAVMTCTGTYLSLLFPFTQLSILLLIASLHKV